MSDFTPASTSIAQACGSLAWRVASESRATAAIDGKASPRKPERADLDEIVVGEFRGRMPLDGEREIGTRHAFAVIGDANQPPATTIGQNIDTACAGIERVLDQFLHHACRTFDDLARGDAVDDGLGKLTDGHMRTT